MKFRLACKYLINSSNINVKHCDAFRLRQTHRRHPSGCFLGILLWFHHHCCQISYWKMCFFVLSFANWYIQYTSFWQMTFEFSHSFVQWYDFCLKFPCVEKYSIDSLTIYSESVSLFNRTHFSMYWQNEIYPSEFIFCFLFNFLPWIFLPQWLWKPHSCLDWPTFTLNLKFQFVEWRNSHISSVHSWSLVRIWFFYRCIIYINDENVNSTGGKSKSTCENEFEIWNHIWEKNVSASW